MRHLDEGTIHAWLDGALSAEEEKKAEAHAARCTECASAVADARGFIAASSRILSALDNVPAGVIPKDYRAMPGAAKLPRAAPRIPAWTLRVAASLVVVATGTLLVLNRYGASPRESTLAQVESKDSPVAAPAPAIEEKSLDTAAPPAANSVSAAPAAGAAAGTAGRVLTDKLEADLKQKNEVAQRTGPRDSGDTAANFVPMQSMNRAALAKPEMQPATAPPSATGGGVAAASAPAALAPGLAADQTQLTPKAPNMQLSQTAGAPAAKRAASLPFPGMHLVREQTVTEETGLVQKRVFEVRPGIEVTLASFALTPPPAAPAAESRSDADSAARDSAGKAARRQFRMKSMDEPAAGINSIQWTDSTGTEFTLSGPLPLDSLRAIRPYLPARPQRQ